MSRWTLILWRCCDEGWTRTTGGGAESARQSTGKPAATFLLQSDARDFEAEGFRAAVGDHETDLGQGFGRIIGQVEAVAAAHGIHFAQGNCDFLPVAARAEFCDVVVTGLRIGLDDEAVVFAVAFEAEDGVLTSGDVEGIEIVLDGREPAIVFERDIAVEDEAAGFIVDHVSARHAAHDAIVFDLPAAHGGGVGEVEEDFGGLGVGLGQAEETDDCEGEKVRHKNLT